jgi:hypothetical protein
MTNGNEPATPVMPGNIERGLTKREYFALEFAKLIYNNTPVRNAEAMKSHPRRLLN